jgi:hypothetical protein
MMGDLSMDFGVEIDFVNCEPKCEISSVGLGRERQRRGARKPLPSAPLPFERGEISCLQTNATTIDPRPSPTSSLERRNSQ